MTEQLGLVPEPTVVIRFHPPDTGWSDDRRGEGVHSATVAEGPVTGRGRTVDEALDDLAARLRTFVTEGRGTGGLSAFDQAVAATERLPHEELVDWLRARVAGEVLLAEDAGHVEDAAERT